MCGIVGLMRATSDARLGDRSQILESIEKMTHSVRNRGPDDSGAWADHASGIGLGHRRLSILDLSPEGHQPMESRSGRYVLVFNGEIYNFKEIRNDLTQIGHTFRGHSDTEVILAAFVE